MGRWLPPLRWNPAARLAMLGALMVSASIGLTTLIVLAQAKNSFIARAESRLDVNLRLTHHVLEDWGGRGSFRIEDGRLVAPNGRVLDGNMDVVDTVREIGGVTATIFRGDQRVSTNVLLEDGSRALGTRLDFAPVREAVFGRRTTFRGEAVIFGIPYFTIYEPLKDAAGAVIGVLYVGVKRGEYLAPMGDLMRSAAIASIVLALVGGAAAVAVFHDTIARLHRREAELRRTNLRFTAALDNMSTGLCMFDADERLAVFNHRYCEIVGIPPARLRPGAPFADVVGLAVAAGHFPGRSAAEAYAERRERISRMRSTGHDFFEESRAEGRVVAVHYRPMSSGGWVATFEDVTERRRSEEQLTHMARHDALTGLANRMHLQERIEAVLARLRRADGGAAVLCLDLDGFKTVNDELGHPAGDELLRQVAVRLRGIVRETDLVARLGGDEFAIVQEEADQPEAAAVLAERLVEAMREPFLLPDQHRVEIGTSVGVVLADLQSAPDELVRSADVALYKAKTAGRGTWRFFEAAMDGEMQAKRTLQADLKRALTEEQFELHYQPLIAADSGVLTGFEALLRWRHPERGLISPAEFIPLAEDTGLIRPIGEWVLRTACTDAAAWPEPIKIAVNLSPVQFMKGDLVNEVERALASSGLDARRLEIEITESVLLSDNEATLTTLQRLRELGLRISMDDFGTGYSSLSYLRRFPFDKIKIDQSFVHNLDRGQGGIEIVRAVVGLGKALGMRVLAEGVETEAQLDILRGEGCDEVQGFLFSKPWPAREVTALIEARAVDGIAARFGQPASA